MLYEKHNDSSNPLLIQATHSLLAKRGQAESFDAVLLARRTGLEPDAWQADLLRSDAQQMILMCSRQAGKSTVTSFLALHAAIYRAPALVLLLSPSLRQSQELFRKVKDAHGALGGEHPATEESALRMEFASGSRIVCLPANEATIRGFSGVALLVIDEASRVPDELYQAVRPMLAVSGGRIVLLSTPFGARGFFHHEWTEGGAEWHRTRITAYDCPRISHEWLDAERRTIGDWWFEQEYICVFKDSNNQVFATEHITRALDSSIAPLFGD
jgi:hypothetical protein